MRQRYTSLFPVILGLFFTTKAQANLRMLQVQFAGRGSTANRYNVLTQDVRPSGILIGSNSPRRVEVEFSPQSDRVALAALEKVAGFWFLRPCPSILTSRATQHFDFQALEQVTALFHPSVSHETKK